MVAKDINTQVNYKTKAKLVGMVKLSMISEKSGRGPGITIYPTDFVSSSHLINLTMLL